MRNITLNITPNPVSKFPTSFFDTTTLLGNSGTVNFSQQSSGSKRHELFNLMKQPLIRNLERNNISNLPGTRWTITDIDTGTKCITVDNELPIELAELGTGIKEKWFIYNAQDVTIIHRLSSVDFDNKKLYYDNTFNPLSLGDEIEFFNPFVGWEFAKYTPLLPNGVTSWGMTYMYGGPIWEHSSGEYRMIIHGTTSGILRTGLASSTDLLTWTILNGGNYMYSGATAPFDKSWNESYVTFCGTASKIPGKNYYASLVRSVNTDGTGIHGRIGVVTYDEDFNILNVPTNPIDFGTMPLPANVHHQYGDLVYYDGAWRISTCRRESTRIYDKIYYLTVDDIESATGLTVLNETIVQDGAIDKTWITYTLEYTSFLEYNGNLYLFLSGECNIGTPDVGSINLGNRQYGVYFLSKNGWSLWKNSPVLVNPANLGDLNSYDEFIPSLDMTSFFHDHMGGLISFIQKDNYLYAATSMKGSTYNSVLMKLKLY